jgi:hypothetical protein
VGMTLVDPGVTVGMIPADPGGRLRVPNRVVRAGPVDMIPEGRLRAANPAVRVDPERLRVPNPVVRAEPGSREATDLRMGLAPLRRMPVRPARTPTRLHLTLAGRRTPVDRRTAVDRQWDPPTRAAACPEATRAVATQAAAPAVAIRRAEAARAVATRRAEARTAPKDTGRSLVAKQVRFCRRAYLTPSTA